MDIVSLLINLASGAAGGNLAGAAMPDKSLGTLGNTLTGLLGGGLGGYIAQGMGMWNQVGTSGIDLGALLAQVGTTGVSGAVVMAVVALIKQAMNKA